MADTAPKAPETEAAKVAAPATEPKAPTAPAKAVKDDGKLTYKVVRGKVLVRDADDKLKTAPIGTTLRLTKEEAAARVNQVELVQAPV